MCRRWPRRRRAANDVYSVYEKKNAVDVNHWARRAQNRKRTTTIKNVQDWTRGREQEIVELEKRKSHRNVMINSTTNACILALPELGAHCPVRFEECPKLFNIHTKYNGSRLGDGRWWRWQTCCNVKAIDCRAFLIYRTNWCGRRPTRKAMCASKCILCVCKLENKYIETGPTHQRTERKESWMHAECERAHNGRSPHVNSCSSYGRTSRNVIKAARK